MTTNDEARAAKRRAMERLSLADHLTAISAATTQFPASVSIATAVDPPPVVYDDFTATSFVEVNGRHWTLRDGVYYARVPWSAQAWVRQIFVPTEVMEKIRPALALETTAGNVPDMPTWNVGDYVRSTKADNGQANIEGPITELLEIGAVVGGTGVGGWYVPYTMLRKVPKPVTADVPRYRWEDIRVGDVIRDPGADWRDETCIITGIIEDSTAVLESTERPWRRHYYHRSCWDAALWQPIVLVRRAAERAAFTPSEVERAKDHGSERYAEQARLCDEARLAEAEREYERVMGPIWGYTTQGDIDGEVSECTRRDSAEIAAARWETRRNFKRPFPGETPGDWARRNGVSAPWADRYAWEARVRAEMDAVQKGEPVT